MGMSFSGMVRQKQWRAWSDRTLRDMGMSIEGHGTKAKHWKVWKGRTLRGLGITIEGHGKAEHEEALKAINVTGQITKHGAIQCLTYRCFSCNLTKCTVQQAGRWYTNKSLSFQNYLISAKIIKTKDKLLITVQFITMPTAIFSYISKNSPQINF